MNANLDIEAHRQSIRRLRQEEAVEGDATKVKNLPVKGREAQMIGHGQKMSRRRDAAIMALLTEPTISSAAKRAGIAESTLLRWLRHPEFKESYHAARREAVGAAIAGLQRASADAVTALKNITNDTKAPATSRVSAARSILELAIKAVELEDVLVRLERLENETGNRLS